MRNDKTRRIMHRRHFPVGGSHPLAMYGRRRSRLIVAATGQRAAGAMRAAACAAFAIGRALPEVARRAAVAGRVLRAPERVAAVAHPACRTACRRARRAESRPA
ncbi:hypothetical protein QHI69_32930 [Burkholderia gladioli pv. gladioli]|uniref:hypothetical protein n=1 Tax=Burkholderia gladioli TaxID=28095 RepID=UPI0011875569|nr:hypothetical protein [Burkholderia gladioli]MDJ1166716.1 hypothetical protein [Burkholderia gladioli pv. gladioli]